MNDVAERLWRVEDRLQRLLASGWRNAAAEASDLSAEADALDNFGLTDLANRLRRVAAARGESEALATIALSLSALRLLRARLPVAETPSGTWAPLRSDRKLKGSAPDRLIPLARLTIGDGEAWSCIRRRGPMAVEWLLVDPFTSNREQGARPPSGGMLRRLFRQGTAKAARSAEDEADGRESSVRWLRSQVQGHLRWRARYPLGASGEVQRCALDLPTWHIPPEEADPLAPLRQALADGDLKDGTRVLGAATLQVKEITTPDVDAYVWPDPAAAEAFRAAAREKVWALLWTEGGLVAPLALLSPGGAGRKPRLIHLVPGTPAETLVE